MKNMILQESKLNKSPRFPYRPERIKWYLMYLWMMDIIDELEFNKLYARLPDEIK